MPTPILLDVVEFAVERVRKLDAVEGFKGTEKEKRVLGWHPEDPLCTLIPSYMVAGERYSE
jgi:hypothetical protein